MDTFRINNLYVDGPFRDFLSSNQNRVTMLILGFQTLPEVNYIGVTDKIDTVSYLPESKLKYVEEGGLDPYSDGIGRTYIKVGRLVLKMFPKVLINEYLVPSQIEEFVNLYKSFFDESNRRIIVVEGEDIRKFYLDRNYYPVERGTLWKSCMRHIERQSFLDLYVVNPKVKMLVILVNHDGVDKVKGRALLWEEVKDTNGNRLKVMDRIYTIYDSDVYLFKRWARENGYISKCYQNAKTQNLFDVDGDEVVMNLSVTLPNHKLSYYPYLDSFQFYDPSSGKFHNNERSRFDYILIQANGGLYTMDDEIDEMDDEIDFDDTQFDGD